MGIYSAYASRIAARNANSVFEPVRHARKIYKDGRNLYELAQLEEEDEAKLENAEQHAEVSRITEGEKREIKDINGLVDETFKVIRDSILFIHAQLAELKKLMKEDEVLKQSGFPIEVANQLEEMLKQETDSIISHLKEMAVDMESENDNTG